MLRDLAGFLKALASEWVAVATGAAVSIASLFWDAYRDDEALTWLRFLQLFLPVTLFIAAFLAWRKEHAERENRERELSDIAARKPEGRLAIVVDKREVYCDVTNTGAQGVFQARLSAPGMSLELRDVPAVWVGRDLSTTRTITNAHTVRLHLAHFKSTKTYTKRVLDNELSHSWMVYYYSAENGIDIRDDRLRPASAFEERELVIRLIGEPELKDPVELKVKLGLGYVMNHEDRLVTVLAEPM